MWWSDEAAEGRATPVLLLVTIAVLMSATVGYVAHAVGDFGSDPPPQLAFRDSQDGRNVTVVAAKITHGSLEWHELEIIGCDAHHLSGPVSGGDELLNCKRPFIVRHIPSDTIVYQKN